MRAFLLNAALACAALFVAVPTHAEGIFVPAPQRIDMVHDAKRGVVYISSSDGQVLRYHLASQSFLSPIVLGGQPSGMDLSPDGDELAVADRSSSSTRLWLHVVDLRGGRIRRHSAVKDWYEGGMWTVAYAADGSILATSRFEGSGWVPLRRFSPISRKPTELITISQDTMLKASADRGTIAFAEANISDGRWGLYDVPTGQLVHREGYDHGTSWFNYEIATDRFGGQFAIPTYGGTYVYDVEYNHVATIGEYAGGQPVGAAYHPTLNRAYFPWAESSEVRVYDMDSFQQIDAYDAEYVFDHPGNWAFQPGRIRISSDGSLLMVSVGGGVRLLSTAP